MERGASASYAGHPAAPDPEPWLELHAAAGLLDQHLDAAVRAFGSAALGMVALPPLSDATPSAGQLRVAAVLLWAREIEAAGLPRFVEALAEGTASGTILLPLGRSSIALMRYWRDRRDRLARPERQAIYARLMGGDAAAQPSVDVEAVLGRLMAALDELGRWPTNRSTQHHEVRIATIARDLAGRLSSRAVGLAAFAARDILAHMRHAARLMQDPELSRALGGRSVWETITMHAPHVLGEAVDPRSHLGRARAVRAVVAWLASIAPALAASQARTGIPASVIDAAAQWRALGPVHTDEPREEAPSA
jgi:hypothetical protein